jgi:hypothetical protein
MAQPTEADRLTMERDVMAQRAVVQTSKLTAATSQLGAAKKQAIAAKQTVASLAIDKEVLSSRLSHHLSVESSEVKQSQARAKTAEEKQREAEEKLEAARMTNAANLVEKRKELKRLHQQMIDAQAALHRLEKNAVDLAQETTGARDQMEREKDDMQRERDEEHRLREEAEAVASAFDDKSLSALVTFLAPNDESARKRAEALLNVRSLDALPSSNAAMNSGTSRHGEYLRAIRTLVDSLISHVANESDDRVEILERAVSEHLAARSRKRARESEQPHLPPVETLLENLARMWRNAKKTGDYVGAKQALSLLLLPSSAKTKLWTHADIIELVSDARSVSVGDRVLVNRGRNTRGVGIVTERHAHGNGSITYSIGPVDVPPRTRRSVGSMTNVPEHDVEHVDSLICRPGEVRGVAHLASKSLV